MIRSLIPNALRLLFALGFVSGTSAFARLGESEAQSQARYGEPKAELIGANDKPLMPGAKELAYLYEGWRVRAAFVNNVTHRIEYAKIPDAGGLKKLQPAEVEKILEAEKGQGTFRWREEKPRTGHDVFDKLKQAFDGKRWKRSDHAEAKLLLDLVLVLETREAERVEKQLARAAAQAAGKSGGKAATPKPNIPKF